MTDVTSAIGSINVGVLHPAMMPRNVVRPLITMLCSPAGIVADFSVGGGTVLLVAEELNHHYIGIDRILKYMNLFRERLLLTF